jgi:hypothetical protein
LFDLWRSAPAGADIGDDAAMDDAGECLKLYGLAAADGFTKTEVKRTWRRLANEFHPDRHGGDVKYVQKMKQVNVCRDKLETVAAP